MSIFKKLISFVSRFFKRKTEPKVFNLKINKGPWIKGTRPESLEQIYEMRDYYYRKALPAQLDSIKNRIRIEQVRYSELEALVRKGTHKFPVQDPYHANCSPRMPSDVFNQIGSVLNGEIIPDWKNEYPKSNRDLFEDELREFLVSAGPEPSSGKFIENPDYTRLKRYGASMLIWRKKVGSFVS